VETLVDHTGNRVTSSHWRTYLVLAHTLSGSMKIASRAAIGQLHDDDVDRVLSRWTNHIFTISQLKLVVDGLEHVKRLGPCVLISHHVSLLDTPCVVASYPGRVRFIAKKELRRVPVFGKAMAAAGIVFVDREDRARAIGQLEDAKRRLNEGYALWVAAEGKRSRDGKLRQFKKGAFHVALALGAPIVPTWIQGTLDVIPPDQWRASTGQTVTVAYGAPIMTSGKAKEEIPALMADVRRSMLALAKKCGAPTDVDAS
jgi:1-acyl-sn-glycerol-3-phosphate acyltransferase